MNNLLHETLICQSMLVCESYDCREFFEFDEVACEPMEEWAARATAGAEGCGWKIGHTGLVKCPKCAAAPR
jgi:hypothetical protein